MRQSKQESTTTPISHVNHCGGDIRKSSTFCIYIILIMLSQCTETGRVGYKSCRNQNKSPCGVYPFHFVLSIGAQESFTKKKKLKHLRKVWQ